jgi:hypothetical protein
MRAHLVSTFASIALLACGPSPSPEPAAARSPERGAMPVELEVAASGEPAVDAPPPTTTPPSQVAAGPTLPMHRVGTVYSLIGFELTDDGIELKLGLDQGGGAPGRYRYLPLVGMQPDLERETAELFFADTTMYGLVELVGKRPHLLRHVISGFRSAPAEGYVELDVDGTWRDAGLPPAGGMGAGIERWSKDRHLELRLVPPYERVDAKHALPSFRVVRGSDPRVPVVPRAFVSKLTQDGFRTTSFLALEGGPVVVVGRRDTGFGALVWRDRLDLPEYLVEDAPFGEEEDLYLLGGRTLGEVRFLAGTRVMRIDGPRLVEASRVEDRTPPDVWLGEPSVVWEGDECYARLRADEPWHRLPRHAESPMVRSCVVTRDGVVWMHEDDELYASEKPGSTFVIDEATLDAHRKKSFLRGGSEGVRGGPMWERPTPDCASYVLALDVEPVTSQPSEYTTLRAALVGQAGLAKPELVIFEEHGRRFAAVTLKEYHLGDEVIAAARKAVKKPDGRIVCAEPKILRRLPIAR